MRKLTLSHHGPICPGDEQWRKSLYASVQQAITRSGLEYTPGAPLFSECVLEIKCYCWFMPPSPTTLAHVYAPSLTQIVTAIGEALCGLLWHSECQILHFEVHKGMVQKNDWETRLPGMFLSMEGY